MSSSGRSVALAAAPVAAPPPRGRQDGRATHLGIAPASMSSNTGPRWRRLRGETCRTAAQRAIIDGWLNGSGCRSGRIIFDEAPHAFFDGVAGLCRPQLQRKRQRMCLGHRQVARTDDLDRPAPLNACVGRRFTGLLFPMLKMRHALLVAGWIPDPKLDWAWPAGHWRGLPSAISSTKVKSQYDCRC